MDRQTFVRHVFCKKCLNPGHVYRYCSATLLYKMPLGRFKQNRRGENLVLHTRFNFMLMMLI